MVTMYGGISIQQIGDYGMYNSSTGIVHLEGFSNFEAYQSEVAKSALLNDGFFELLGNLTIYGTFTEQAAKIGTGGNLEVKESGSLNFYD